MDLDAPLPTVPPCSSGEQWVLLRLHSQPLGLLFPPNRGCSPQELARLAFENHGWAIAQHRAIDQSSPRRERTPRARVTVAVCTRNR
ncbi:MAG TPA: hypothetical protein VFG86_07255, partial [Chloroflexota bacterium]|nr:hypothetical protein [Chloroflexota bacterium]